MRPGSGRAGRTGLSTGRFVPRLGMLGLGLHDVLVEGRKVAGAAQRRTRGGLIHQGSIQTVELPADFGAVFAARLAGAVVRAPDFDVGLAAERLAAGKYGTRAWLEKRL